MKATSVIVLLVAGSLIMGGAFWYILGHSQSFQADAAGHMKTVLLTQAEEIQVQTSHGELWVFPKDPASWTFQIQGTVLQVTPSTPSITKEGGVVTYASLGQAPAWEEVKKSLHALIFERLRLNPKPSANNELEILAPAP